MGRLKKDHGGWRTSGLWLKYQTPKVNEINKRPKSKKDTNKWCRGKVGREHEWHRYQGRKYSWELDNYVLPYVYIKCLECKKEKYVKTAKSAKYPMHLWVEDQGLGYEPVQVRVNGKYLPIDYLRYEKGGYYCYDCGVWH